MSRVACRCYCHLDLVLNGLQAWLALRAPALRSVALEQRLWARTLPAVGAVKSLDQARAALYRDLVRGYQDRCLQVLNSVDENLTSASISCQHLHTSTRAALHTAERLRAAISHMTSRLSRCAGA